MLKKSGINEEIFSLLKCKNGSRFLKFSGLFWEKTTKMADFSLHLGCIQSQKWLNNYKNGCLIQLFDLNRIQFEHNSQTSTKKCRILIYFDVFPLGICNNNLQRRIGNHQKTTKMVDVSPHIRTAMCEKLLDSYISEGY